MPRQTEKSEIGISNFKTIAQAFKSGYKIRRGLVSDFLRFHHLNLFRISNSKIRICRRVFDCGFLEIASSQLVEGTIMHKYLRENRIPVQEPKESIAYYLKSETDEDCGSRRSWQKY